MAKLLRVRDYVLLSAAFMGDVIEGIRSVGGIVPFFRGISYGYIPPNYKKTSYFSSVSKLLSTGDIERKADADGKAYLELTSKGTEKFKRKFPLFLLRGDKWDRNFMVVIFDVREVERGRRDRLRLKLKNLGFGMMQESVYISPYHFEEDLREYLELEELSKYVFVFKADSLALGDYKGIAEKVWRLSDINSDYGKILDDIKSGQSTIEEIWEKYIAVLVKDPTLPFELLPHNWKKDEIVAELGKLGFTKNIRP